MLLTKDTRAWEIKRYERVYKLFPDYTMKGSRRENSIQDLILCPVRGSYLDVSCGKGEMLKVARTAGFDPVKGTEVVKNLVDGFEVVYAEAHALPFDDKSVDVVSLFDVIEHLIPGDDESVCREIERVAIRYILLSASNKESVWDGFDLHINKREYSEWNDLFRLWFKGKVKWYRKNTDQSNSWIVEL